MTDPRYQQAAEILRDAYTGGAVPPLREWLDPTDADGAYANGVAVASASATGLSGYPSKGK